VRDTGRGIARDQLVRIFEPSHRTMHEQLCHTCRRAQQKPRRSRRRATGAQCCFTPNRRQRVLRTLAMGLQLRNNMGTVRASTKDITTDVLDLLVSQHREVDDLLEKLEQGSGDRRALFVELADTLAAHAAAEEKVFYPAVMTEQTSELLHESVEEHLAVKRVLADLITMDIDEDEFDAKLSVLKEQVSHHAHEEEEGKLFPILRTAMSPDERAALGNEYLVLFETLMQSHPYRNVPGEIQEAAPLPPVR
jgi:Trp operon repressor